jgi:MinD-like ATPase involved in chromosome partitioning or flagellar assembly
MNDQADDLRRLAMAYGRPKPIPIGGRPIVIALTGGDAGVGTTTIAIEMATQLTQAGKRTLLLAGARWSDDLGDRSADNGDRWIDRLAGSGLRTDVAVVDVGNYLGPTGRRMCREADIIVLVTTTETTAVLGTFAAMKTLVQSPENEELGSNGEARLGPSFYLRVTRAPTERDAETIHYRLRRASQRFLGVQLETEMSIHLIDRQILSQSSYITSFHIARPPDGGVRSCEPEGFAQSR